MSASKYQLRITRLDPEEPDWCLFHDVEAGTTVASAVHHAHQYLDERTAEGFIWSPLNGEHYEWYGYVPDIEAHVFAALVEAEHIPYGVTG